VNDYSKKVQLTIRQIPETSNALGKIKFVFPNNYSIYLHDTLSKNLFNVTKRAFSHRCIRIQELKELVLYLLRDNFSWNEEKGDKILKKNSVFRIDLKPNIPIYMYVYIVFFKAWVDRNEN
jgi:L,D-transpeptidase YcbB